MSAMGDTLALMTMLALATLCTCMASAPAVTRPSSRSAMLAPCASHVRMGWTEPEFSKVLICEVHPSSGAGLAEVTIEAGDDLLAAYTKPGQFVQLRPSADVKPGFFAIASAPGAARTGCLEFLIKETDSTTWLTQAAAGQDALMCAPMGKGFDLSCITGASPDVPCSNVAFCAAGTGIAPVRAVIEASESLGLGVARSAQLFYGCRSLGTMAYRERFDDWRARGVEVLPVLSQAPCPEAGFTGYVQDALKEPGALKAPAETAVVLCGSKDMQERVKEVAVNFGIPAERILTNF